NQLATLVGAGLSAEPETILTVPNDASKYGPLAGTILTGDEKDNKLFTIDTNGLVTPYAISALVENLNLIPTNQDLYVADAGTAGKANGIIWKVSRNSLTNFVGDILVTDEGNVDTTPLLEIVHWDGQNFVTTDLIQSTTNQ